MEQHSSLPQAPPEVLEYLESQYTMTLATAASGLPHAATLVYVNRDILFYVCTNAHSATATNIDHNPAVAFTIDQYNPDWNKAKGILATGEATRLSSKEEIQSIVLRFQDKFPFLSNVDTSDLSFYCITPVSIEYIDNEQAQAETRPEMGLDYQRNVVFNIFHDLPPREVDEISVSMEPVSVAGGEVVVRQGDPADRFFVIVEGEVEVTREDNGTVNTVAYLGRGKFFGEMAVLMDIPRTATVTARTPTQLLAMPRGVFRSLVSQSLSTSMDFDAIVQQRLEELARLREG
jgi:CRP-like cAMP-binding protein/uncharacterized protein YhbP (UPF0306 family)